MLSDGAARPARRKLAPRPAGGLFVCMAFIEQLGSTFCRSLGPVFMLFGMSLVASVCFIALWWDPLVPLYEPLWKRNIINGVGLVFVFNIYFNWIMCARTNPGNPSSSKHGRSRRDGYSKNRTLPEDDQLEDVLINTSSDTHVTQRRAIPSASSTPLSLDPFAGATTGGSSDGAGSVGGSDGPMRPGWKQCKKCVKPKPPRAHHCSICDNCILAMDHHCPWVASCVGYYNYRYFYLFLFYLVIACAYVSVIAVSYYDFAQIFGQSSSGPVYAKPSSRQGHEHMPMHVESGFHLSLASKPLRISPALSFACLLSAVIVPSVGALLGFHTYLILTAQTTIEFYGRQTFNARAQYAGKLFRNDFDLGNTRNWELVFGKSRFPLAWARPSTRKPPGDGLSWPTAKSLVMLNHEQIV